jgi:hypothetical protein
MIGRDRIRIIARRLSSNMPESYKDRVELISYALEQEFSQDEIIHRLASIIESDADLRRWASYISMDRRDGSSRFRDAFEAWAIENELMIPSD